MLFTVNITPMCNLLGTDKSLQVASQMHDSQCNIKIVNPCQFTVHIT